MPEPSEHAVGARPQEAHHEPVGVAVAAHEPVRERLRADRDDAVERLDEVRVEQRRRDAEPPAVLLLELLGKVEGGEAVDLVEELERIHERWTSARKSCRSAWSSE